MTSSKGNTEAEIREEYRRVAASIEAFLGSDNDSKHEVAVQDRVVSARRLIARLKSICEADKKARKAGNQSSLPLSLTQVLDSLGALADYLDSLSDEQVFDAVEPGPVVWNALDEREIAREARNTLDKARKSLLPPNPRHDAEIDPELVTALEVLARLHRIAAGEDLPPEPEPDGEA